MRPRAPSKPIARACSWSASLQHLCERNIFSCVPSGERDQSAIVEPESETNQRANNNQPLVFAHLFESQQDKHNLQIAAHTVEVISRATTRYCV